MKLSNVNTILLYISLVLSIIILLSVIFGCFFRKNRVEKFSTTSTTPATPATPATSTTSTTPATSTTSTTSTTPKSTSNGSSTAKFDNKLSKLSKFESGIIQGLSSGKMSNADIEKFIQNGQFTKENLNNMISAVEEQQNKK